MRRIRAATTGAAMAVLVLAAGPAWPQTAPPSPAPSGAAVQVPSEQQPPPAQPTPAAPPTPEENSGLINEIGKLFGKLPSLKSPGETMDDLNARAKDATDTLSRFTASQMVTGRVACPASANGAPDCKSASDQLCQAKGFKEGKSLLTDSSEHCSAKVLIPGRARKPDDCRTDTYVTRAVCQ